MKGIVDIDNLGTTDHKDLPALKDSITTKTFLAKGNRYKYKFYEKGQGKSWEFEGFVVDTDLV